MINLKEDFPELEKLEKNGYKYSFDSIRDLIFVECNANIIKNMVQQYNISWRYEIPIHLRRDEFGYDVFLGDIRIVLNEELKSQYWIDTDFLLKISEDIKKIKNILNI